MVATLLDEEVYLCSERTMYRVLASEVPVQERRAQRTHPEYKKPELMATAPNQVWSWDITRLLGPKKWSYYYLYVIMDIYSRYVVGWMVADRENSALAGRLIQQSCLKHGVQPRLLTLHSDRGAPMTSQCTAQLLADLGVTRSLSRPQVSDDNPFSEAQFKTLKYHPSFPGRFGDQGQAKTFCRSFFRWYNAEHRHGGISMLTPEQVHFGNADQVIAGRKSVLREAWAAHPERFVRGVPKPKPLPEAVFINPPIPSLTTQDIALWINPVECPIVVDRFRCATLSIPSCGFLCLFDHERGEFSPTDWRRLQFFENLVGSRASEWPLVPLLCLVRRHSTTDNGLLIRRQIHDRNLTLLPAAADEHHRSHDRQEPECLPYPSLPTYVRHGARKELE